MRVAYLLTQYPKVSHTFIRREILELERRGHEITRITIRAPEVEVVDSSDLDEVSRTLCVLSQPIPQLLYLCIRTAATRPIRSLRALATAAGAAWRSKRGWVRHVAYIVEACFVLRILERGKIRHLHVHFGTNAADVAQLVSILGSCTYSITIHGPTELDDPIGYRLGDKILNAAFTVAISWFTAAQLQRWAPLEASGIHVIRCSVGRNFLNGSVRPDPAHQDLVFVGRLTGQKGLPLLLEAFAKAALPRSRLVLAGDGELRLDLERQIAVLGIAQRVQITGWLSEDEVRWQILASRAVVLPSFAEGLPVVLMEAFALGRPVISTYVAGIPELVENEKTGWLVPAGDANALAQAMGKAVRASKAELSSMAIAARATVETKHSLEKEVGKLEALLDRVASGDAERQGKLR